MGKLRQQKMMPREKGANMRKGSKSSHFYVRAPLALVASLVLSSPSLAQDNLHKPWKRELRGAETEYVETAVCDGWTYFVALSVSRFHDSYDLTVQPDQAWGALPSGRDVRYDLSPFVTEDTDFDSMDIVCVGNSPGMILPFAKVEVEPHYLLLTEEGRLVTGFDKTGHYIPAERDPSYVMRLAAHESEQKDIRREALIRKREKFRKAPQTYIAKGLPVPKIYLRPIEEVHPDPEGLLND